MNTSFGRHLYGLAAIAWGVYSLAHTPHTLQQIAAVVDILGGLAIQWLRTARFGAIAVGAVYLIVALSGIPLIIGHPLVYNGYGNFFEQISFVAGALILYATAGPHAGDRRPTLARIGYYAFGICVISFALEQFFYLPETASLVPKWIPPTGMFWAIATTLAFALAGAAMLAGRMALLASRLTVAMLLGFGLLVWLPILVAAPHSALNWSESIITLGIAASAWIVADFLARRPLTR